MNSNATQSTAAASGLSGSAFVVILVWVLGLRGITLPPDVAAAIVAIFGAGMHFLVVMRLDAKMPTPNVTVPAEAVITGAETHLSNPSAADSARK